jgi:hypothetical protein
MNQLNSHWTDFHEIWYLSIFRKSVKKIQVSLKSHKNNGYFTWRPRYFFDHLTQFFSEWEMFQTKIVEEVKTHILCSGTVFRKSRGFWDNMENFCRAGQATAIWCTRIACWIPKDIDTHSEYVILIAFPLQQWLRERASVLRLYVHSLSCYRLSPIATSL